MDQGSMSTVIEHGVVDPKPTVKAVAYCKEPLLFGLFHTTLILLLKELVRT